MARPNRPLPRAEPVGQVAPRVLCLSGGGVRGLFSASVLARLDVLAGRAVAVDFQLLAGTSIGGIIALGLASGKSAAEIAAAFKTNASGIFALRPMEKWRNPKRLRRARYDPEPLKQVISKILGPAADQPMSSLAWPALVTTVDTEAQCTQIFASGPLQSIGDPDPTILDAALATSAAPTYFPAHVIGKRAYVDGGLTANAPDLIALEYVERLGIGREKARLLSIGTAGLPTSGPTDPKNAGGARWLVGHELVEMTFRVQEGLATRLASEFMGERYLRIDRSPDRDIKLDDAADRNINLLERLGEDAANMVHDSRENWQKFIQPTTL